MHEETCFVEENIMVLSNTSENIKPKFNYTCAYCGTLITEGLFFQVHVLLEKTNDGNNYMHQLRFVCNNKCKREYKKKELIDNI
jgi:hypothetical protein